MDKKNLVWCVDTGNSFSHLIHSELFLTEKEAKEYYDRHSPTNYRKMYQTVDIWNFRVREYAKNRLKKFREASGLSQSKLAEASGVNVRMIQYYEQGVKDINKAEAITVYRLAKALDCTVEDLIRTED